MRRILFMLLTAATLLAADATIVSTGPQIPRKAPELVIQMPGKQMLLSQFRGYICAVAFMSTTCPHCQHLSTVLAPIQQEYAAKGVQVLGVVFNPEANTDLANFSRTYAQNLFPIGMSTDPTVAEFVQHPPGIHYIPMMAFIDKNGVIRAQHLGFNDTAFFTDNVVVQNIKNELDKIIKEPTVKLPDAKTSVKKK
jgi:thiol-disulfide isomerase/thioredoxin